MDDNLLAFSTNRTSLLGTESFRDVVARKLNNAEEEIILISAFITKAGIEWFENQIKSKNIKCTIIVRWKGSDLHSGSSDLISYEIANRNGWQLKILDNLHAKIICIDKKYLFIGSPNLTGRGMSLVPISNMEMGVCVSPVETDIKTINSIINESIEVNDKIFNSLNEWLSNQPPLKKIETTAFPDNLKKLLSPQINNLWTHNFPFADPQRICEVSVSEANQFELHDLEMFDLINCKQEDRENLLSENFRKSKVFLWLAKKLKEKEEGIFFGELSSLIHDTLYDDPRPYRTEVKDLQKNLYTYIKFLKFSDIEITTPKSHSERIRLI